MAKTATEKPVGNVRDRVTALSDDVQDRVREMSDEVRRGAERASAEIRRGYDRATVAAREGYDDAAKSVRKGYRRMQKDLQSLSGDVNEYVRDNPGKSVLIAAGVGFLVGLLFRGGKEE